MSGLASTANPGLSPPAFVTPGTYLADASPTFLGGVCTYVLNGKIYSSAAGIKTLTKTEQSTNPQSAESISSENKGGSLALSSSSPSSSSSSITVVHVNSPFSSCPAAPQSFPGSGDIILGRISRITHRQANVDILLVSHSSSSSSSSSSLSSPSASLSVLSEPLSGIIRSRDIRAFEIDSVVVADSFQPGDLVRAKVLSLGDARHYFLSTAANDLGVLIADGPAGIAMIAISWDEMKCPITNQVQKRKIAKIEV